VFSLIGIPISFQDVGAAVAILAALRQRRVRALLVSRKEKPARTASLKLVGRELGFLPHGTAQLQPDPAHCLFLRLFILLLLDLFLDL
jgi:hypothetical protein